MTNFKLNIVSDKESLTKTDTLNFCARTEIFIWSRACEQSRSLREIIVEEVTNITLNSTVVARACFHTSFLRMQRSSQVLWVTSICWGERKIFKWWTICLLHCIVISVVHTLLHGNWSFQISFKLDFINCYCYSYRSRCRPTWPAFFSINAIINYVPWIM